jgi:hypothetical protein
VEEKKTQYVVLDFRKLIDYLEPDI